MCRSACFATINTDAKQQVTRSVRRRTGTNTRVCRAPVGNLSRGRTCDLSCSKQGSYQVIATAVFHPGSCRLLSRTRAALTDPTLSHDGSAVQHNDTVHLELRSCIAPTISEQARSCAMRLHAYREIQQSISYYLDDFKARHGRRPTLEEVRATNDPVLIDRFQEMVALKQQLQLEAAEVRSSMEQHTLGKPQGVASRAHANPSSESAAKELSKATAANRLNKVNAYRRELQQQHLSTTFKLCPPTIIPISHQTPSSTSTPKVVAGDEDTCQPHPALESMGSNIPSSLLTTGFFPTIVHSAIAPTFNSKSGTSPPLACSSITHPGKQPTLDPCANSTTASDHHTDQHLHQSHTHDAQTQLRTVPSHLPSSPPLLQSPNRHMDPSDLTPATHACNGPASISTVPHAALQDSVEGTDNPNTICSPKQVSSQPQTQLPHPVVHLKLANRGSLLDASPRVQNAAQTAAAYLKNRGSKGPGKAVPTLPPSPPTSPLA